MTIFSEPNSEEASGPNNSDTGHSGSKTEEHKVPSISNGNQLKDVVTARNDRSGTAAFHSRNRSYQNVYANDLEMEEDEEETLDYDSSEDFVNDHNGHDERSVRLHYSWMVFICSSFSSIVRSNVLNAGKISPSKYARGLLKENLSQI